MTSIQDRISPDAQARAPMRRDSVTWYCYLLLGFFTFTLTIQGNVLPFLMAELDLSYGKAGLHSSAIAAGMILVGLYGDRFARRAGRAFAMRLGLAAVIMGLILLAFAPAVAVSIVGCFLIGAVGALIPAIVFAVLSDVQGDYRTAAYSESNAVSYAFAIMAPLSMSLVLALALSWRLSVLSGAAVGLMIALAYRRIRVPAPIGDRSSAYGSLPAAFWAYWCCLGMSVAIEFCVLLWAPTFLEQVVGLSSTVAAGASAVFSLAMLIGRTAGSSLVRAFPVERLFVVALLVTAAGFVLYWGTRDPYFVLPGLFVIGLGVALLYPLALGLAVSAAGAHGDAASARVMIAVGLAIMFMPAALGGLADGIGLHNALLILPALIVAAFICFAVAQVLQRKAAIAT